MVFDKFSLASLSGCFIKDTLSVKLLSGLVMADPVLKDYFPDKLPERDFFWGVVFAIKPAFGNASSRRPWSCATRPRRVPLRTRQNTW